MKTSRYLEDVEMKTSRYFLALCGCSVVAVIAMPYATTRASAAAPILSAPMAWGEGCTYHCRSCGSNPAYHDVVVHVSQNNDQSSVLEDCNAGSCYYHECGGPEEPHGEFVFSPETSGEDVLELMRLKPNQVKYNAERKAIQLYCEEGVIVASLPVSTAQAEALDSVAKPVLGAATASSR